MTESAGGRPIPVLILTGHGDAVWRCAFSPDGTRIASVSRDTTVRLWDAFTGGLQTTLSGHRGWVRACAFSPEGTLLATGSRDRSVKLWDIESAAELATLKGHADEVKRVAFCLGGARLVTASLDGAVKLWDVASGSEVAELYGPLGQVMALAVSPDGEWLAAAHEERVTVWSARQGTRIATLRHADLVRTVAFAPGSERLVSGAGRGALTLWSFQAGERLVSFSGHTNYIASAVFSPDGRQLASGSSDYTVRIWNPETRQATAVLTGHSREPFALAFSGNGRFLASAAADRTVRWWNAETGASLATLTGHSDDIHGMAFSADGTRICSASHDRTLRLWILQPALRETVRRPPSRAAALGYGQKLFAFLSYRRESGAETARLIRAELLSRGLRSFLDVDDLGAHHFDESLLRRIEEATHFILVLSPGALERCANEGDWLRREIAHAIATERNVVPVLKEGFRFPAPDSLPSELAALPRYNCVEYSHIYFEATMTRLLSFCHSQ